MFDAWGISIFVGFDFHNVDALRPKSRKELLTLLFRKLLILRKYSINIVCHNRCFLFMKRWDSDGIRCLWLRRKQNNLKYSYV